MLLMQPIGIDWHHEMHGGRNIDFEDVDFKKWKSPALFVAPATNTHGDGRLNSRVINTVWNEVCELGGVGSHTPP